MKIIVFFWNMIWRKFANLWFYWKSHQFRIYKFISVVSFLIQDKIIIDGLLVGIWLKNLLSLWEIILIWEIFLRLFLRFKLFHIQINLLSSNIKILTQTQNHFSISMSYQEKIKKCFMDYFLETNQEINSTKESQI